MRVSFDLDDTIFVNPQKIKVEKELIFPLNRIFKERLRFGTISLFKYIREHDIELWIYTTSFRSPKYIRSLFKCYGIKLDRVINGDVHAQEVQKDRIQPMPSKYPSRYRIDLHIDDDISVEQNGKMYGFKVFIVGQQDDEWSNKIIDKCCLTRKIRKTDTQNAKKTSDFQRFVESHSFFLYVLYKFSFYIYLLSCLDNINSI